MNELQHETSPYLLQHADNPVHWLAWNATSLNSARTADKPILLSIGYSTCHWCHVMAHESFEDPDIAAFMNAHFINIKVDREERPDLDALYMESCQVITGTAGWPLHVFLTPDLKPFFAGTYFPPESEGRRLSWFQALQYVHYNYRERRSAVEQEADRILHRMSDGSAQTTSGATPDLASEHSFPTTLLQQLAIHFDGEYGGFGTERKFPNTMALELLLHHFFYYRSPAALRHFRFTISTMLKSGLYDQIGGGIARYTVDRAWRIPHFEKMLYDNALFAQLLARAYRLIGRRKYKTALIETLNFLERELRLPQGGFGAALDADSPEGEGRYYTWNKTEVEAILGADAALFCTYFGITETGNWDGTNILYQPLDRFHYADQLGLDREALLERMHTARRKMLAARARRMSLHRDEKLILGWNAMMVSTYVQAHWATGETRYANAATELLDLLEERLSGPGDHTFFRTWIGGKAAHPATLSDYAFLIRAQLDVFELTQGRRLLDRAVALADRVEASFRLPDSVWYSYARTDLPDLIQDRKDIADEDMPSGNALMVRNHQDLYLLTGDKKYRQRATVALEAMQPKIREEPLAYAAWANAWLADREGVSEIALLGEQAEAWKQALQAGYLPFRIMIASRTADDSLPLLAGKTTGGGTRIYLCRDQVCQAPMDDPAAFSAQYFRPPDLAAKR